ncbi:MFS transporter, partial [Streptococcus pyogenes]
MIGFQSAFEGMGGILTSFLVAQLILFGWRHTLWTYLLILPVFTLFTLFVPDIKPLEEEKKAEKVKIDKSFVAYIFLL